MSMDPVSAEESMDVQMMNAEMTIRRIRDSGIFLFMRTPPRGGLIETSAQVYLR